MPPAPQSQKLSELLRAEIPRFRRLCYLCFGDTIDADGLITSAFRELLSCKSNCATSPAGEDAIVFVYRALCHELKARKPNTASIEIFGTMPLSERTVVTALYSLGLQSRLAVVLAGVTLLERKQVAYVLEIEERSVDNLLDGALFKLLDILTDGAE